MSVSLFFFLWTFLFLSLKSSPSARTRQRPCTCRQDCFRAAFICLTLFSIQSEILNTKMHILSVCKILTGDTYTAVSQNNRMLSPEEVANLSYTAACAALLGGKTEKGGEIHSKNAGEEEQRAFEMARERQNLHSLSLVTRRQVLKPGSK